MVGGGGGNRTRVRRPFFEASTCLSGSRSSRLRRSGAGKNPMEAILINFHRTAEAYVQLAYLNDVLPKPGKQHLRERSRLKRLKLTLGQQLYVFPTFNERWKLGMPL